jgi:hypothetical protein
VTRYKQKIVFFPILFTLSKIKRSYKIEEIDIFYFFCLLMEESGSVQIMTDLDPGDPKLGNLIIGQILREMLSVLRITYLGGKRLLVITGDKRKID